MPLSLYYHPLSSYCHKVLIALYETGTIFEPHLIDLGSETDRALLGTHWPLCKFPVLFDPGRGRSIPESTSIIEYLSLHHAGDKPLIPSDPDRALDARLWDRIFDNYVHTPMQQIVADRIWQTNIDLSRQRVLIRSAYQVIDTQLSANSWAAGADFTLADCAAAPALFYATTLEPIAPGQTHLAAYFGRLISRPSVRRVLDEARPYFRHYPFADAIPARFRGESGAT